MVAIVNSVISGSIAEELGISKGDELLSIDNTKLLDMIDYNYYCKSDFLTLEIKKADGNIEEIELEKDFDEDLGIIFESAVFDKIKPCLNKCVFCFVDQQPKGLRESLYIKDDDYRLSFMQGTYITLTNITDDDKKRIAKMHLGPFYISVHTTNPSLRVKMMKNPNAANIMKELNWFKKNDIPFHTQIVLCPGINDGEELDRTLSDLSSLEDSLLSVAIVPVGITKYRLGNELREVDKNIAIETINISKKYKKVCCSDEFFIKASLPIPDAEYYGSFSQLDDGVGSIRILLDDFKSYELPNKINKKLNLVFATSYAGAAAISYISDKLNEIENLFTQVKPVKSTYWGQEITVAGLITSQDLINSVKDIDCDYIIIPGIMLQPYSDNFLDGKTLKEVEEITNKKFIIINNQYSLCELIDFINCYNIENQ